MGETVGFNKLPGSLIRICSKGRENAIQIRLYSMRLECDYLSNIQRHYKNYAELASRMTRLGKNESFSKAIFLFADFYF